MGGSSGATADFKSTIFNMVNCIVGSGALTIPYAMERTGFLGGMLLLLIVGGFSLLSFYYLVVCSDKIGLFSYSDVLYHAYGKAGRLMAYFAIVGTKII